MNANDLKHIIQSWIDYDFLCDMIFFFLSLDRLFDIINILSHIVSLVCSHWNEKKRRRKYIKYIVNWIICWMLDQNVYTQLVNSFCDEQRALCSEINRRTSIKIVPCLVYRKNTIWIFNNFFFFERETSSISQAFSVLGAPLTVSMRLFLAFWVNWMHQLGFVRTMMEFLNKNILSMLVTLKNWKLSFWALDTYAYANTKANKNIFYN